jgi:hypothetical protein
VAGIVAELPADPTSPGTARESLEPLRGVLNETAFIDLRLLVSELVTEAINDERSRKAKLRAELRQDHVWIAVGEEGADAFRL